MTIGMAPPVVASINGTITANSGQTVVLPVSGYGSISVMVFGTYGAVNDIFEISLDGGTTYDSAGYQLVQTNTSTIATTTGSLSNTTRVWGGGIAGATHFRVRNTAWTSGTQNIYIVAFPSANNPLTTVQGNIGTVTTVTGVTTVSTLTSITNTVTITGSVSISSIIASAGATSMFKTIQTSPATAASGDIGIAAMVVRKNSAATLTSVDGSYTVPQVTGTGNLRVALSESEIASIQVKKRSSTRSDTYTVTGNGITVDVSANPLMNFSVEVKGTAAGATTWDIRLEGSNDNVNFSQILQHTNTTGDGLIIFSGATASPCLYFRSRCAGLVLGGATNIVVTIVGME